MTLTRADADFVRDLVRERSAIVLDGSKDYLIESRLAPVARKNGLGSLEELVFRLRRERSGPLHDLVVDAMTTNETTFFRDVGLWQALEEKILPELFSRRAAQQSATFWSAACSSGQEPYSLAMLLVDRFPQIVRTWNIRILATDLSSEMLGRAAAGRYTQLEVNRGMPARSLVTHFRRTGAMWQVSDRLREMVEFRAINLVRPWPFVPEVDVLFMRNVLIYFDLGTKREILGRCRKTLRTGGHLILGTSETTLNIDEGFQRTVHGPATTYRPK